MKIGCHISTRGGYAESVRTALKLGAESFQYFPKNPRGLGIKTFNLQDAELCASLCREHGIVTIGHTPYPTNPAADEGELRSATVASLQNDLAIADACGSLGIIVHFGKYKGPDALQGYKNIIQCINEVLRGYEGSTLLLLENQAGEGTQLGTQLEELVMVRRLCERPELVGFCLDTCHAFASGLWPGDAEGWPVLEERAEAAGYLPHLHAIHLNDSLYPRGARKDRHARVGSGEMGEERLAPLLRSPVLQKLNQGALPVVLETPVGAEGHHGAEIRYVKELSRG